VIDTTLYLVATNGTKTSIGTVAGSGRVTWGVTSDSVVVCATPNAYTYNNATFAQVTDADYTIRGGGMVTSLDNYVLFNEPNSGRFFGSDLNNPNSYDPLYFATAEGYPDNLVGLIADHRQLVLAGYQTIELWYNAGGTGFPFTRDTNGFIELGCLSGPTLAKADNSVFWLASDKTVRRLSGVSPVRVSQHGVEQAISGYTTSDAYAFTYTFNGHIFYTLCFPTSGATWVFDITTGEWHERETYLSNGWGVVACAEANGLVYVMASNGTIGTLSNVTYSDFGSTMRSEWTFSSVAYSGGSRTFHKSLEVLTETGVGITTGQGSDPEIMLDVSDDGGRTWRGLPTRKIGAIGKHKTRVRWERLGSSRDRIYRMAVSDPVRAVVTDAMLEVA
jgi:hypothetical protein